MYFGVLVTFFDISVLKNNVQVLYLILSKAYVNHSCSSHSDQNASGKMAARMMLCVRCKNGFDIYKSHARPVFVLVKYNMCTCLCK